MNRLKSAVAVVIIVIAAAVLWRKLVPEPSIEQVARLVSVAIDKGDAGGVRRWMLEQDLERTHLNERGVQTLIDALNRAKSGWTASEPELWTQGSLGNTDFSRKYTKGPYTAYLSFSVVMTSDGPRVQLLDTLIGLRYYLEQPIDISGKSKGSVSLVSLLIGLQRDQGALESLGITGMPSLRPGEPAVPWVEYRRKKFAVLERVGIKPGDYGLIRP